MMSSSSIYIFWYMIDLMVIFGKRWCLKKKTCCKFISHMLNWIWPNLPTNPRLEVTLPETNSSHPLKIGNPKRKSDCLRNCHPFLPGGLRAVSFWGLSFFEDFFSEWNHHIFTKLPNIYKIHLPRITVTCGKCEYLTWISHLNFDNNTLFSLGRNPRAVPQERLASSKVFRLRSSTLEPKKTTKISLWK